MRLLLDTHIFLWFVTDNDKLSIENKNQIENSGNEIFISIASLWEIAIKISLLKLDIDIPFENLFFEIEKLNIQILNINKYHLIKLKELDYLHRDPFDRLIISQAINENLTVITNDKLYKEYNVKVL